MSGGAFVSASATAPEHLCPVDLMHIAHFCPEQRLSAPRETGSVAAKPMGGDYRSRLTAQRAWLLERIEAEPDLTLEELRDELKGRGVSVGYRTVWRFFAREDVTVKKKRPGGRARAA